jgi:hypothetical protein
MKNYFNDAIQILKKSAGDKKRKANAQGLV